MRYFISSILNRISLRLRKISLYFYTSPHKAMVHKWHSDNMEVKRIEYDLSKDSVVFDVGGYKGQWSSDIFARYLCEIHVFEPVIEFAKKIEWRFKANDLIKVNKFGLSNKNYQTEISLMLDGSSVIRSGEKKEIIELRDILEVVKEKNIKNIDLIKINIEGCEYDLIERMIEGGLQKNIKNIQIQFHNFMPDSEKRMLEIRKKLSVTHKPTYCYDFVWENWQLIDIGNEYKT